MVHTPSPRPSQEQLVFCVRWSPEGWSKCHQKPLWVITFTLGRGLPHSGYMLESSGRPQWSANCSMSVTANIKTHPVAISVPGRGDGFTEMWRRPRGNILSYHQKDNYYYCFVLLYLHKRNCCYLHFRFTLHLLYCPRNSSQIMGQPGRFCKSCFQLKLK